MHIAVQQDSMDLLGQIVQRGWSIHEVFSWKSHPIHQKLWMGSQTPKYWEQKQLSRAHREVPEIYQASSLELDIG